MKTNAITRIIIWSLILVILLGVLAAGLFLPVRRLTSETPAATAVPVPLEETTAVTPPAADPGMEATVTATAVNVRSAPTSDSPTAGKLEQNDTVVITNQHIVEGEDWAFITSPCSGWVQAKYLQLEDTPATATTVDTFSIDPKQIREIDIEWAAGSIVIEPAEVDSIQISEAASADIVHHMVWKQNNHKLSIRYSDTATFGFGINITDPVSKDLTVLVPMGWECESLEVDAASATLDVKNLVIREMDFDGASGTCSFHNCVLDELDIDTASGDIYITGTLNALDCDAASASVYAVLDNVPTSIDMDSMSGNLDITLPADAGFTVSMDALSSDFTSDFPYREKADGTYYRGDGKCRISMDAMSGDLYIREYKAADALPAVPEAATAPQATGTHHHTDACTTDPASCPDTVSHHEEPHHD